MNELIGYITHLRNFPIYWLYLIVWAIYGIYLRISHDQSFRWPFLGFLVMLCLTYGIGYYMSQVSPFNYVSSDHYFEALGLGALVATSSGLLAALGRSAISR